MDASSLPPDAMRELADLRRRAYGPHHNIEDDPAALARLTELEARRAARSAQGAETDESTAAAEDAPVAAFAWSDSGDEGPDSEADIAAASSGVSWRSLWHRTTATRSRRNWLVAALGIIFGLAYTVEWLRPDPDATLHQIAEEGDEVVISMLSVLDADVNPSSIRGYEPYEGLEPWFSMNRRGLHCFMIIDRSRRTVDGANCVPPGVDLSADIGAWPLSGGSDVAGPPDGSVIRFHYRGNSVDVFHYPASEAD
ncbi:hypothetical protein [Arthrobacter sp. CAN_A1]|uniref:hypothetical protein n=1 Tax=Arthrobacter sp. CAN_A1 TaxID=2787717 RepID=UPI0018C8EBFD